MRTFSEVINFLLGPKKVHLFSPAIACLVLSDFQVQIIIRLLEVFLLLLCAEFVFLTSASHIGLET